MLRGVAQLALREGAVERERLGVFKQPTHEKLGGRRWGQRANAPLASSLTAPATALVGYCDSYV